METDRKITIEAPWLARLFKDSFSGTGVRPAIRVMITLWLTPGSVYSAPSDDAAPPKLDMPGGYVCTYPVFQGVYRMIERMLERGGQSVYLMLCTIVDKRGVPMRDSPALDRLSRKLGDALSHSVRRSDAICRYGKGQYLALLMNTTREDCGIVQKRVNYYFLAGTQRAGVEYYVNSVFFTREGDRLKNA